jgi:predicted nucleotidyltransferase
MTSIYVFGSTVRGEVDKYSDVDLLLVTNKNSKNIDKNKYSIYTPERIKELYAEGNPFAWHLYFESKLIYSEDDDYLLSLGKPSKYDNCENDLIKFKKLFDDSVSSIRENEFSMIFDLSMIFLAIRNFATCYTLSKYDKPIFSRLAFEKLHDYPLKLDERLTNILMMSRISSTRGIEYEVNQEGISAFMSDMDRIENWFNQILVNYESRV